MPELLVGLHRAARPHRMTSPERPVSSSMARRLFELVEPVAVVAYMVEPNEAVRGLGAGKMWDAYFAGRARPVGPRRAAPRSSTRSSTTLPTARSPVTSRVVWDRVTPAAANAAREQGTVAALRPDARRPRREPQRRSCCRARDQGRDQRPDGGTGPLRRGPDAAGARPSRWLGCGTEPTCYASTAATATSPRS